jgi:hypothetical protein
VPCRFVVAEVEMEQRAKPKLHWTCDGTDRNKAWTTPSTSKASVDAAVEKVRYRRQDDSTRRDGWGKWTPGGRAESVVKSGEGSACAAPAAACSSRPLRESTISRAPWSRTIVAPAERRAHLREVLVWPAHISRDESRVWSHAEASPVRLERRNVRPPRVKEESKLAQRLFGQ